jgi:predicted outer membrane protein
MFASRLFSIACLSFFLCLAPLVNAEEDAPPSDTGSFAIFDQLNSLEIAVGRTAAERGGREEVRALGRLIVHDQESQQREGRELGYRLKIFAGPPRDELGSYSRTVAALMSTPAGEFDRAYLKQEMVIERNVIDALSRQQLSIREPALAAFLREVVRSYERHLEAVKAASAQSGQE